MTEGPINSDRGVGGRVVSSVNEKSSITGTSGPPSVKETNNPLAPKIKQFTEGEIRTLDPDKQVAVLELFDGISRSNSGLNISFLDNDQETVATNLPGQNEQVATPDALYQHTKALEERDTADAVDGEVTPIDANDSRLQRNSTSRTLGLG